VENFDEEPTNRDEDYLSSAKARENDDQNGALGVLLLCFPTLSFTSFFFPSCIGTVEAAQYGEKKSTSSGHAKHTVPWTLSEFVLALFKYPFHRFLRLRTVPPPLRPSEVTAIMMVTADDCSPPIPIKLTPLSPFFYLIKRGYRTRALCGKRW
jgi:hypothetical protein